MTNVKRRTNDAISRGIQRIRQLTFDELVSALELCYSDATVRFTFGMHPVVPTDRPLLRYYEGFHDHASIEYSNNGQPPTVQELLEALKPLRNATMETEHGELRIDPDMPIWAGHDANDTALVEVTDDDEWNTVFLQTWAIPGHQTGHR